MSLEAHLEANTAAMKELTAAILASNVDRAAAIEKLTASGATAEAPARRGRQPKPSEAPPAPAAEETPPAPETSAPSATPTEDEFMTAAGAFMEVTDETVRTARKVFVKAILDHLGVAQIRPIKPEDRSKVIGWFKAFLAGQTVNFSAGEDDQADDDMMG